MRTSTFDIPAQPLLQALTAFGRQSGLQVTVDSDTGAGKTNAAVSGTMTADEALRRLLAGTGLTYQFTSADAVTIAGPPASPAGSAAVQLDPVRVGAASPPPQAEIGNLPPAYAGDDVARGGKVGLLGVRDFMDMPFSETTYTEQHIQNQQARTLTDVLAADPTVRSGWPNGNVFDDRLMIRGVLVLNPNYGLGGLYGIVPNEVDTTGIERVEVFRGPSAFLNGALPQAVGGTINLVPKRATDAPHRAGRGIVFIRFAARRQLRFRPPFRARQIDRPARQWQLISGNTSVNSQSAERLALTVGLDYRSGDTRMDADLGFLRRDVQKFQGGMFLGTGVQLPPAPQCAQQLLSTVGASARQRPVRRASLRTRHCRRSHRVPEGGRATQQLHLAVPQSEHHRLQRQYHDSLGRPVQLDGRDAVAGDGCARQLSYLPRQA